MVEISDEWDARVVNRVNYTWARRCNDVLLVMRDEELFIDPPAMVVGGRGNLRALQDVLRYVRDRHAESHSWFVWTTAASYILVENLR